MVYEPSYRAQVAYTVGGCDSNKQHTQYTCDVALWNVDETTVEVESSITYLYVYVCVCVCARACR